MQTDINKRNSNINMILCFVIGVVLALTVKSCADKPQPTVVTKGEFKAVEVTKAETKAIPGVGQILSKTDKSKIDTLEAYRFKTLYNLTQKEYDSLLVRYAMLDSMKNASNDKYYQDLYEKLKPIEFSHLFDNGTLKATVSGISNGAPQRLKLDWEYKAPPPKKIAFALWGGVESGITKSFDKFNTKVNLDFQIGENTMIKTAFDTDQRIYLGLNKSIFSIKR